MSIRKSLARHFENELLSKGSISYIPATMIIMMYTLIFSIWWFVGYPYEWILASGLLGWTLMITVVNGECILAVKLMVRPIDDEIYFLTYISTDHVQYRCKLLVNLLYMRQHRTKPLVGTTFEDKTYTRIDDFKSYFNEPYYMVKRSIKLPDEFWEQKY